VPWLQCASGAMCIKLAALPTRRRTGIGVSQDGMMAWLWCASEAKASGLARQGEGLADMFASPSCPRASRHVTHVNKSIAM
jgi:hypothetical protein